MQKSINYRILCYYTAHNVEIEITHYSGTKERLVLTPDILGYLLSSPTKFKLILNEQTDKFTQKCLTGKNIPFVIFEKMLSEHIDCFGLINDGLAIKKE